MSLDLIKQLREKTGASIADCNKCLKEAGGDLEKAIELIKKCGAVIALKKGKRQAGEGIIGAYVHSNNKIACLVKIKCETDFVARNKEFQELAKNIAMQITAMDPSNKEELMNQQFIKDESITIDDLIKDKIQKLGENIEVTEFVRMEL